MPQDFDAKDTHETWSAYKEFGHATVLKLHGSVDWVRTEDGIDRAAKVGSIPSEDAALYCKPREVAIATPGPSKRELVASGGPLVRLWEAAATALHEAEAVVFLGYRIPPTDAYTRQWLVEQLRKNERMLAATRPGPPSYQVRPLSGPTQMLPAENPLRIHTVLGDNVRNRDSARLRGILEELDDRIVVKQWAMFAEDFLGIVDRERLR